jgi:hypothetical protein
MIPYTRRAMSRQAGPSIVLSVLIVGFFAVALFQRDSPRSIATRTGFKARDSASRPTLGGLTVFGHTPSGQGTIAKQGRGSPAPVRHEHSTRAAAIGATDGKKPASSPDSDQGRKVTGRPPRDINRQDSSGLADRKFQQVSTRSPRPKQSSRPDSAVASKSQEMPSARSPRSAFTVVEPSETIEDVSSRVYGTTGEADLLWRANRDTLPQRDSPLSTGMLLRTPSVR